MEGGISTRIVSRSQRGVLSSGAPRPNDTLSMHTCEGDNARGEAEGQRWRPAWNAEMGTQGQTQEEWWWGAADPSQPALGAARTQGSLLKTKKNQWV